jgi:serine/threonine protein kinase
MSLLEPGSEIGRYTLLGRLATGGMAEIYLARQSGPSGFTKVVVLKVILPHLANDPTFMKMFANEARLAALLNHPNVVQVFDYGEERRGLPFMAMEYIDGRNLTRIGKALHAKGERIPRGIALRVISEVCGALDYAHGLCDTEGNHLGIVHRDISRDNILLTYSGRVKLVDFGIARSTILESYTTEGTIKGKYAYMAPEVIRGADPDHLIDIYALGVVLYSTLLGRLPFRAKNHAQLLEMILTEDPPPPTQFDPTMPEDLEALILKAMHKDREQRFQRVADLQHVLEEFLAEHESAVHTYHLARFMAGIFPAGSDQDRETYQRLTGTSPSTPGIRRPSLTPSGEVRHVRPPEAIDAVDPPTESDPDPFGSKRRIRIVLIVIVAAVLGVAAGALLYWKLATTRAPVKIARIVAQDAQPRQQPDAAAAQVSAPDAKRAEPDPDAKTAEPAPDPQTADPRPGHRPPRPPGFLSVDAPTPGEVQIGRWRLGPLPLVKRRVPAGTHRLVVHSKKLGYRMQRAVTVRPGGEHQLQLTPAKGTIRVLVHPWAKVTLDGVLRGVTPLKPISVYEGPHVLVLENSDVKQKQRVRVKVTPDKESLVKVIFD